MGNIPEPRKFKLDTDKHSVETQKAYDAVVKDIQTALYDEEFDLSRIQESSQKMTQSIKEDYVRSQKDRGAEIVESNNISQAMTDNKVDWAKKVLVEKAQQDGAPGASRFSK